MRLLVPALLAAALGADPAAARSFSATCSNLSGMRVEDAAGDQAFRRDAVAGAAWAYTWDVDSKKATLTLPAAQSSDGRPHTQPGVVTFHRGGFFTIVSTLPGAVWTHAIYADSGRLLVTQTTTRNGAELSGRMLVGTCSLSR